jgi:hypothetical protein
MNFFNHREGGVVSYQALLLSPLQCTLCSNRNLEKLPTFLHVLQCQSIKLNHESVGNVVAWRMVGWTVKFPLNSFRCANHLLFRLEYRFVS